MKPYEVSSVLNQKKIQNAKVHFGIYWTQIHQTSHCDL